MLNFPDYAIKCLEKIEDNGFEAYFVGGCVRDMILGKECDDIDIATSARPEEIIDIFENTVPTGIKHGTVTVIIDSFPIEVTTYRTDGQYIDSRHPENVEFVSSIEEDLCRRDFTINALAYNPKHEIIDLFNGIKDLKDGKIRAVGDPKLRFSEDALRILRAYRFSSVLDFDIEKRTEQSAVGMCDRLSLISGERIYKELVKLSAGIRPQTLYTLLNKNGLKFCGIGSAKYDYNTFSQLKDIKTNLTFKFALLISLCNHDTATIKTRLKAEKKTIEAIDFLDSISENDIPKNKIELKRFMFRFGSDKTDLYFSYVKLLWPDKSEDLVRFKSEIEAGFEPYMISHLKINGQSLLNLGYKGEQIGKMLNTATEFVIENPDKNSKEEILKQLQKGTHQ